MVMAKHESKYYLSRCKGNGFVWVTAPEPKKDRWAIDCKHCDNQGELKTNEEEKI